ncbi:YidH family protein, partial [Photobacterium sanctipauli]
MKWTKEGQEPDYRFTLANERTFLAWIRTALAFLAAAIALDQLTPEFANPQLRLVLSVTLASVSAYLSILAYRRWRRNEMAMRSSEPLPYTRHLKWVSIVMMGLVA